MKYYIVKNKSTPYGDYSDTICIGLIRTFYWEKVLKGVYNNVEVFRDEMKDLDIAELIRTGPYVPEIYIVDNLNGFAMTENFMKKLEHSGLKGEVDLKPTVKKKIVNLAWQSWGNEDWENYIKRVNEPEDVYENGKHDKALAKTMPNIFYFVPMVEECKLSIENNDSDDEKYVLDRRPDADVFRASNMLHCIVSENFKKFLDENVIDNLSFNEITVKIVDGEY